MRWFRTHRLRLTSLALFALACHFVLSFGHVHGHGRDGNWARLFATVATVEAASEGPSAELTGAPGQPDSVSLGDFCAVCANISLVGAGVTSVAPTISRDAPLVNDLQRSFGGVPARPIDLFHFEARGPPPSDAFA
jgi:hypothetical protein